MYVSLVEVYIIFETVKIGEKYSWELIFYKLKSGLTPKYMYITITCNADSIQMFLQ